MFERRLRTGFNYSARVRVGTKFYTECAESVQKN